MAKIMNGRRELWKSRRRRNSFLLSDAASFAGGTGERVEKLWLMEIANETKLIRVTSLEMGPRSYRCEIRLFYVAFTNIIL